MFFAIELAFDDHPDRMAARPAHRARLANLHAEGQLLLAGPWRDDSGALLVFRVEDPAAMDTIIESDPYYTTHGVTVVSRTEWTPIIGG